MISVRGKWELPFFIIGIYFLMVERGCGSGLVPRDGLRSYGEVVRGECTN